MYSMGQWPTEKNKRWTLLSRNKLKWKSKRSSWASIPLDGGYQEMLFEHKNAMVSRTLYYSFQWISGLIWLCFMVWDTILLTDCNAIVAWQKWSAWMSLIRKSNTLLFHHVIFHLLVLFIHFCLFYRFKNFYQGFYLTCSTLMSPGLLYVMNDLRNALITNVF